MEKKIMVEYRLTILENGGGKELRGTLIRKSNHFSRNLGNISAIKSEKGNVLRLTAGKKEWVMEINGEEENLLFRPANKLTSYDGVMKLESVGKWKRLVDFSKRVNVFGRLHYARYPVIRNEGIFPEIRIYGNEVRFDGEEDILPVEAEFRNLAAMSGKWVYDVRISSDFTEDERYQIMCLPLIFRLQRENI